MSAKVTTYNFSDGESSHIFGLKFEDVERVDPMEYIIHTCTAIAVDMQMRILQVVEPELLPFADKVVKKNTLELVSDHLNGLFNLQDKPTVFIDLLSSELKKKEQIAMLKPATLTKIQLEYLMYEAGKLGYTFSQYRIEELPKNVEHTEMPDITGIDNDGQVFSMGETSMSEGQLKATIDQRKFELVKVFDKGDIWHCFYFTRKGMLGEESGAQGSKPHIHYLSSAFGITRDQLMQAIKDGRMPSSPVHIGIFDN